MTDPKTLVDRLRSCRISAPPEHAAHPHVCDEAADRIEELEAEVNHVCVWKQDHGGNTRTWRTDCNEHTSMAAWGGFCTYCGGKVEVSDV